MKLVVNCIGKIAQQVLAQEEALSLRGVTSQGLFLQTSKDWIVFLSRGNFRGPLTLNLNDSKRLMPTPVPGSLVLVSDSHLYFCNLDLSVYTGEAIPWAAPPPTRLRPSPKKSDARLLRLGRRMLTFPGRKSPNHLLRCTLRVLGYEDTSWHACDDPGIRNLAEAVSTLQDAAMLSALEPFLGLGLGLTPSGDDLTTGLLLVLNRWGSPLLPDHDFSRMNDSIVQAARRKTSALIASLIQCATLGQADERLILALDGILTGYPDLATCASHLASWGHSSGADALAGMALALRYLKEESLG